MTRNEKTFLKRMERAQRLLKAELKRLESFNSTYPGNIRGDKLKKMRHQRIYMSMMLRLMINAFHKDIVEPREDRYVHVSVVKRLRARIEELEHELEKVQELAHV
jgi:hypothetical protein